jgi:two-component system response regulator FlrC
MQRALILQDGALIRAQDLGLEFSAENTQASALQPAVSYSDTDDHPSIAAPEYPQNERDFEPETEVDLGAGLGRDLKQREFEVIVRTIRDEKGSRKRAAERLGISPRTLRYKIARFRDVGLAVEDCL